VLEALEIEALRAPALEHLAHAHVLEARQRVEQPRVQRGPGDDAIEQLGLAARARRAAQRFDVLFHGP
jgi:hypothetical protein